MKRYLIVFFLSVVSYLFSATAVFASGEFKTDYEVSYYVQDKGPTLVQQNITLTNLQTNLYATESEITLGTTNIDNISARDNGGNLAVKLSQDQDNTKIRVYFNQKVVGKDKTLKWVLKYQSNNIATKVGLIKEINLPRLELDPDISSYNLEVLVPPAWGQPAYVKPVYKTSLKFNKNELSQGQISIAYGSYQVFDFKLSYHLKNTRLTPVMTEIALPPDTNYQKVYLKTLNPVPLDVTVDQDGNWLAKYSLAPGQVIHVTAAGSAQLFLNPLKQKADFRTSQYLTSQKYWESGSAEIQKLAAQYKTPQAIYNYVVSKLKYNYDKVSQNPVRLGALAVLNQPDQAICMEFTDLFIAIARAAGIPAREVDGYAYTTNQRLRPISLKKDILHAWPEYYDGEKWVQVDPTWQNTTGGVDFFSVFDFNHLAFVIKGLQSEYPYPAGSYKIDGRDTKDVEVTAALNVPASSANVNLNLIFPPKAFAGFGIIGDLVISNLGDSLVAGQKINLKASGSAVSPVNIDSGLIPPFGKKDFSLSLARTAWFQKNPVYLLAAMGPYKAETSIAIKPIILIYFLPAFLLLVLAAGLITIKFKRKK